MKIAVACVAALSLSASVAWAEDFSNTLTGEWSGLRSQWADNGYLIEGNYQSQAAHNFTGGDRKLTRYTDQFSLIGTFDFEKIFDWQGATFQAIMTERSGRNLNIDANIGAYDQLQAIWGRGQTWWLTMFALKQKLLDDRLEVRLGRLTVEADFDSQPCDFQNITFCGGPPGNLVGDYWINWPASQWAGVVTWHTTDSSYIKAGAYQLNETYLDSSWARSHAWQPNFPSGTVGALIPVEYGWASSLFGQPSRYMVGAWYSTAGGSDRYLNEEHESLGKEGGEPLEHSGRYGAYFTAQQQLTGDANKGWSATFNFAASDKATSYIDHQATAMVKYKGVFDRPADFVGLGIGATHGNPRYAAYQRDWNEANPSQQMGVYDGYEYESEVFYNWSPVPGVNFRPNVQWIIHPGGSDNGTALILGLNTIVVF
ncbi:carbohydrate porin [Pseudomonas sp. NPDC090592]|uniref:carbohydrate porin n=1 Tax=Pseudomonas sp. NPDC090592 TaxID=3364480 RepID=UPI00383ADCF0